MAAVRRPQVASQLVATERTLTTSIRRQPYTLDVGGTRTPTAIINRPLPSEVPSGPSQNPDTTVTLAATSAPPSSEVTRCMGQGLSRTVAEALVRSGSRCQGGALGAQAASLNASTSLPSIPQPGSSTMAYQLTVGGNSSPYSGPSTGPSIVDRGVGILEDFIRSKLIPGQSGGSGTAQVPGAQNLTATPSGRCPDGSLAIPGLPCVNLPGGAIKGGGALLTYGEAVLGRYGAGLVPASTSVTTHRCPRGAVLGNDGLCYNKRDLRRSDRMWIPPRKPLLTGGDLNAISRASRAATKMKTQQKRLEKLGLLKKPTRRAPARRSGGNRGSGITVIDTE